MKYRIFKVLLWLDDHINHTVIDWFFDLFPVEDKQGRDTLAYKIWKKTARAYCNWVVFAFDEEDSKRNNIS